MIAILYERYDCWSWYYNHDLEQKKIIENNIKKILHKKWNLSLSKSIKLEDLMDGFIYILVNPLFKDNTLKIGKTRRNANERAKEVSSSTGIPVNFIVVYEKPVVNCDLVEQRVHEKLEDRRVNKNREFFNISQEEAIKAIEMANEEVALLYQQNIHKVKSKPVTIKNQQLNLLDKKL